MRKEAEELLDKTISEEFKFNCQNPYNSRTGFTSQNNSRRMADNFYTMKNRNSSQPFSRKYTTQINKKPANLIIYGNSDVYLDNR